MQSFQKRAVLLLNQGSPRSWLSVRLRGTRSNRDAIGARVVVEAGGRQQQREVRSTAGYLSGCSLECHFGLGEAERIDRLTVHWPSGLTTTLEGLDARQRLTLVEGQDVD